MEEPAAGREAGAERLISFGGEIREKLSNLMKI